MPSPFPGMNPYFEQAAHWLDFHTEFLSAFAGSWPRRSGRSTSSNSKSTSTSTTCRRNRADALRGTAAARLIEAGVGPSRREVPFLEVRDRQGREW